MAAGGVRVSGPRWVVHLDIDDEDIRHVVDTAAGSGGRSDFAEPKTMNVATALPDGCVFGPP